MTPKTLRKKVEKELRNLNYYVSVDQVVEEKGLMWRIKPSYAKDKAYEILSLLREALLNDKDFKICGFLIHEDITRLLGGEV